MKHHNYSVVLIVIAVFTIAVICGCNAPKDNIGASTLAPSSSITSPSPSSMPSSSNTPESTPKLSPEPTVGHAMFDYINYTEPFIEGYNYIDSETKLQMIEKSVKKEGENLDIPVYSDDEMLLGIYANGEGAYNCTWPGFDNSNIHFGNSTSNKSSFILAVFPGGAWRKTDDGRMYLMYDTDRGSRIYIFFSAEDNYENAIGYSLISCKRICYKDISGIKLGDSIEDVMNIDPTAKYVKVLYDRLNNTCVEEKFIKGWNQPISTVHLLTDGIMKITYERSGEEGDYRYTVTNIEYHENFELDGIAGITNYRIAETDYVDNE